METAMNNKNLVVGAQQHLATQVKAANIQLLISSQLMQDIERRRFVEILNRIDSVRAVEFLSGRACLNEGLIAQFEDKWDWLALSRNKALPWSLALIEQFKDQWDWKELSWNEALPWSLELIERFEDKWDCKELSGNEVLPWSLELIERFEDKWDWEMERLNQKAIDCLPKLSVEDIDEVMAYHSLSSNSEEYYDEEYGDDSIY